MEHELIDIGGNSYRINLEKMSELLVSDKSLEAGEVVEKEEKEKTDVDGKVTKTVTTRTYPKSKEFDAARFDVLGSMFQIVLSYNEEADDTLGVDRILDSSPIPFKIAYNTLLSYGILEIVE
jgi:hypothetical protein